MGLGVYGNCRNPSSRVFSSSSVNAVHRLSSRSSNVTARPPCPLQLPPEPLDLYILIHAG